MKKQFTLILMLLTALLIQACKPDVIEPDPEPEPLTLLEKLQGRWRYDSIVGEDGVNYLTDSATSLLIRDMAYEHSTLPGQWVSFLLRTGTGFDTLQQNVNWIPGSYRIVSIDTERTLWLRDTGHPSMRITSYFFTKIK